MEPFTLGEVLALADDDARDRWEQLSLGYTESSGLPALREAIASEYASIGPDRLLVVSGAEEGVFLLAHALLAAGDEAVVVTPAFQSLHSVPRGLGARVREVALREDRRWELDPDEVARATTPKTRLIVVAFPHNPTGAHITPEVQRRLVEIAEQTGAVLLSDEVYRGLEPDEASRLRPAADLSDRAVSLGVMSKTYALPGLRIGWLATHNKDLLARVARLKDYTTICNSAPSEVLALMALRARDRVVARSREIVAANRSAAARFFAVHEGALAWVPPRAGSTALPRFLNRDPDDVARQLREQESILLVPGRLFGGSPQSFRLGLGRRDLPEALAGLARVLAA